MSLSRRNFFTLASATAASTILMSPLKTFYALAATGKSVTAKGFGELMPDSNGILDLPREFQYRVFSKVGEKMSDGTIVPNLHDGMGAFAGPDGTTILVRNHELNPSQTPAVTARESDKYDKVGNGGTTTLIVGSDRTLREHYVSLAGTVRNCAGGVTPWGSWISCEEDVSVPLINPPDNIINVTVKHGYNFEVPANGKVVKPEPLIAMGRFRHEAIAVDPKTDYIYQTEDREDGCFYRFRPNQKGNLKAGGVLEAMVIKDMPKLDTSNNYPVGKPRQVEWVRIEDVDPPGDTLRYEAQSKGAAIFRRGEGTCYEEGEIYWTCTDGGKAERGQIFRYNLAANTVELFVESTSKDILDYPDNLTITPFGHLMVCEDGEDEQFLVGINPQGQLYHFARNALNKSEFAGICFSGDGQTMFVNIYNPGMTLAIWGPWSNVS